MNKFNKDNAEIGARIKEIRLKRNMTQEVLSEKAGICSPQQMSNIERGLAGLSVARLKDVCKVLDIDSDYILFGITNKNADTVLSSYLSQMSPEQIGNLLDIVRVYAKSCGIKE